MTQKQIVCMNWGSAYGSDYVNRLYNMVKRNITGDFRFVCLTDRTDDINPAIECHPCPTIAIPEPHCNRGWRKLNLWNTEIEGLEPGDALFIDLDVVITDSIDCFFEPEGDFIVARNWTQANADIGNTSVYRFRIGSHPYLLTDILDDPAGMLEKYPNSQTYISRQIKSGSMTYWPEDWCCSFKVHCIPSLVNRWIHEPHLPEGTRIVAFPGTPNPHEALKGEWPAPWYKKIYKHIKPSQWIEQHWC